MPKVSLEFVKDRQSQIVASCLKLYEHKSLDAISIKEVAASIDLTRSLVYAYFLNKEEILLEAFGREFLAWSDDLKAIAAKAQEGDIERFATLIGKSLQKRRLLLKILAVDSYALEDEVRIERLVKFKCIYKEAVQSLDDSLKAFFPRLDEPDRQDFIYCLLPFMVGIYPYAFLTPAKQEAMDLAQASYPVLTIEEMAAKQVSLLLTALLSRPPPAQ